MLRTITETAHYPPTLNITWLNVTGANKCKYYWPMFAFPKLNWLSPVHCWYRHHLFIPLGYNLSSVSIIPIFPILLHSLPTPVHLSIFLSSLIYHIITWHCQLHQINNSLNLLPHLPLNQCSLFPVGLSAVSSNLLPFANLCPPLAQIQHACPEKPHSYTFPPSWIKLIVIPSFPSADEVFLTTYCHMLLKHLQ